MSFICSGLVVSLHIFNMLIYVMHKVIQLVIFIICLLLFGAFNTFYVSSSSSLWVDLRYVETGGYRIRIRIRIFDDNFLMLSSHMPFYFILASHFFSTYISCYHLTCLSISFLLSSYVPHMLHIKFISCVHLFIILCHNISYHCHLF